jgi:hypothetical protein
MRATLPLLTVGQLENRRQATPQGQVRVVLALPLDWKLANDENKVKRIWEYYKVIDKVTPPKIAMVMCILCGDRMQNDAQDHAAAPYAAVTPSGPRPLGPVSRPCQASCRSRPRTRGSGPRRPRKPAAKSKSPPPAKKQRLETPAAGQAEAELTWFHETPSPTQMMQMLHIIALRDVTSEASSRSMTDKTSSSSTASSRSRQWVADLAAAFVVAADKRALAAMTTPHMARFLQAYGADGLEVPSRHRIRKALAGLLAAFKQHACDYINAAKAWACGVPACLPSLVRRVVKQPARRGDRGPRLHAAAVRVARRVARPTPRRAGDLARSPALQLKRSVASGYIISQAVVRTGLAGWLQEYGIETADLLSSTIDNGSNMRDAVKPPAITVCLPTRWTTLYSYSGRSGSSPRCRTTRWLSTS